MLNSVVHAHGMCKAACICPRLHVGDMSTASPTPRRQLSALYARVLDLPLLSPSRCRERRISVHAEMAASSDCGCSEAQPRIHPEEDKEWCIVNFYHLAALPNPEEVRFACPCAGRPMCLVTYSPPMLQIIPSFRVCLCTIPFLIPCAAGRVAPLVV